MLKSGILHPQLNRVLAETGHTDVLTICDRGFPVPVGVERVDLALIDDIPTVLDVLRAMDGQFVMDTVIIAEEMKEASAHRYEQLRREFSHLRFRVESHPRLKQISLHSRAVIRTGDSVPYANIVVVSG